MLLCVSFTDPPKPADFNTIVRSVMNSPDSNVNITLVWDTIFNSRFVIEFYIATISDTASCPMSCPSDRPCVCVNTGQLPMEGVNITISAVNCNNLEGSNTTITVFPQGNCVIKFCSAHNGKSMYIVNDVGTDKFIPLPRWLFVM